MIRSAADVTLDDAVTALVELLAGIPDRTDD